VFVVPVPYWTRADGVIWVPQEARVRAAADGFFRATVARPGEFVGRGTPLVVADNPELMPKIHVLEAQLQVLETRANVDRLSDRVKWELTREEATATRQELEHMRRMYRDLTVLSPTSGTFVLSLPAQDLPDRFLRKGQELGFVVPAETVTARVLVSQDSIDLVRSATERVRVMLAGRTYETFEAKILREVPAASNRVENLAMSSAGGGQASLDPQETQKPKTLNSWFEFELALPATRTFVLGEHVYARFEHAPEPLAWRIYRSVRQLFLRRFAV
jgi:putative peptide zinc metalloprotease protein